MTLKPYTMPASLNEDNHQAELIIFNAIVVSMNAAYTLLDRGAVAISKGIIVDVGESLAIMTAYRASDYIDADGKLLIPGLINAHTHSPMTIFRGYADDIPLKEWLYEYIFPVEARFITPKNVRLGTRLAMAEMIRSGTTTFNDMYYYSDHMAEEVDKAGMRAVLTESLIDFAAPNSPDPQASLAFTREMIEQYNSHPRICFGLAVHSAYSASAEVYRKALEMAAQYKVPLNTHVAETRWEFDLMLKKHGKTPVGYLNHIGALAPGVVAAHAVHLTDDDMEILAENGVGVAHNPQCNMKLANGVAPIPQLLSLGIAVGIGTDGVASNNDLDMFDEMRSSALSHKLNSGDPTTMNAREVFYAATAGGARLLGMEKLTGSIEIGKQADLVLVNTRQPHAFPWYNIYSQIVYSLKSTDVDTVMVGGKILMKEGRLLTINQEALYDDIMMIARDIGAESPANA